MSQQTESESYILGELTSTVKSISHRLDELRENQKLVQNDLRDLAMTVHNLRIREARVYGIATGLSLAASAALKLLWH